MLAAMTGSNGGPMTELRFLVPGISCRHCAVAITAEVAKAQGVENVQVEPGTNWVVVCGPSLDVNDIRAAVMRAGHQAEL
jgi:copper chaperone